MYSNDGITERNKENVQIGKRRMTIVNNVDPMLKKETSFITHYIVIARTK